MDFISIFSPHYSQEALEGPLKSLLEGWELGFRDWNLLLRALTHSSFVHENPGRVGSNERLEFLGDSVLGLVVSAALMHKGEERTEGELSRLRAHFVSEGRLAERARRIGLGACLRLGKGERQSRGHERDAALADAVEALIGALYLDQGLAACERLVTQKIVPELSLSSDAWDELALSLLEKDAKSRLQEFLQQMGLGTPRYVCLNAETAASTGPFEMALMVEDAIVASEWGPSKKEATQHLARRLLAMPPGELVRSVATLRLKSKGS